MHSANVAFSILPSLSAVVLLAFVARRLFHGLFALLLVLQSVFCAQDVGTIARWQEAGPKLLVLVLCASASVIDAIN